MRTTAKLSDIVQQWLRDTDVAETTRVDYGRKIHRWFRWLATEGIEPRTPVRGNVLEWKRQLQARCSMFTMASYITVVKLFYTYCEEKGHWDNIAAGVRSSFKQREYYKKALTAQQSRKLLNSVPTNTLLGKRDKLIITLMLTNGLRAVEIERINLADFESVKGGLHLHIQRKGAHDKRDVISISPLVVDMIEDYTSDVKFDVKRGSLFYNLSRNQSNQVLTRQCISRIVKMRLIKCGIDDKQISGHSLRHTCGCMLVEQGVDVELIRDVLGHSSTKTTRIYVNMAIKKRLLADNPANKLAKLLLTRKKRKK